MNIISTDRLIWLFLGWYRYIGHSWTDIQHRYFQNFLILFSALLSKIYCILCLTLSSKTSKIRIYEQNFSNCRNFNMLLLFLINLINDGFCFSCDGRRVLHGSSCLLAYENAPTSVAATQLSWLGSLCFLAQVVCMRDDYNSILSTPTLSASLADTVISAWLIYQYISNNFTTKMLYNMNLCAFKILTVQISKWSILYSVWSLGFITNNEIKQHANFTMFAYFMKAKPKEKTRILLSHQHFALQACNIALIKACYVTQSFALVFQYI